MAKNSKSTSQYASTPIKDWYLDTWIPKKVPSSDTDKILLIPPAFDKRPDLLSFQEYGTAKLWWVFSVRNPNILIDPVEDFVAGIEIYIPKSIL